MATQPMEGKITLNLERPSSSEVNLEQVAIRLHPVDDVAIARQTLMPGLLVDTVSEKGKVKVRQLIQPGHKVALNEIAEGSAVRRYGQIIGFATRPIQAGDHVHSHNMAVQNFTRDYAFASEARQVELIPPEQRRTFQGYLRPNGRVGTRNYIAILGSVNCSASTIKAIANSFSPEDLKEFPNVDGVIGLTHKNGCGMRHGGDAIAQLQMTLAGFANHANVGAYLLIGLGCETNQIREMIAAHRFDIKQDMASSENENMPLFLTIQETGGVRKTVEAARQMIAEALPKVNQARRTEQSVEHLIMALQCGGSDGWSGITANPALGFAVDELVRNGGTAVLSETPEIYGAEHMLTRRARSEEVGQKLIDRIKWWEHYTGINGQDLDNNPSPGNKLGGLTTIYEKSLGAIAKGGQTQVNAVYKYAEPITEKGLVIMDTPGYDPVSATGQVAGGANVIVFTTGRGSVFGFKPAPSIKVATNTTMYEQMTEDMDVNAGKILSGVPLEEVGREIFELVIRVASGEPSKSEAQGIGEEEFNPWILGAML
ncbi:MAG: galactonate dehydratase [Chloroflexi bacterium]|jgi:altronate hydrolase|nr:galactonate dehydratase [Chloroflexota bacterium]